MQSRLDNCHAPKRVRLVYCKTKEKPPPPQLSIGKLVFSASSGLVVAPTTVMHIRQSWGLGERLSLTTDESRALQ